MLPTFVSLQLTKNYTLLPVIFKNYLFIFANDLRHDTLVLQDEKTKQVYICLALKYIHGFTLDKYLNVNTVSIDLFRNILIQVCETPRHV